MKTLTMTTVAILIAATNAMAATGAVEGEGLGLLASLFIAFGVMIVLFQFIPGVILFAGIIKGVFAKADKVTEKE